MLAQIEKGTANPSLGVLGKITSGLRIEFQKLIDPPRMVFVSYHRCSEPNEGT